jgi:hypothetical protein
MSGSYAHPVQISYFLAERDRTGFILTNGVSPAIAIVIVRSLLGRSLASQRFFMVYNQGVAKDASFSQSHSTPRFDR